MCHALTSALDAVSEDFAPVQSGDEPGAVGVAAADDDLELGIEPGRIDAALVMADAVGVAATDADPVHAGSLVDGVDRVQIEECDRPLHRAHGHPVAVG